MLSWLRRWWRVWFSSGCPACGKTLRGWACGHRQNTRDWKCRNRECSEFDSRPHCTTCEPGRWLGPNQARTYERLVAAQQRRVIEGICDECTARNLARATDSFTVAWDNRDDAAYDKL